MQRCSIELGGFHDEHPGREFIFEGAVVAFCAVALVVPLGICGPMFTQRSPMTRMRNPFRKRFTVSFTAAAAPSSSCFRFHFFSCYGCCARATRTLESRNSAEPPLLRRSLFAFRCFFGNFGRLLP
jgi:hypothetical protein